MMLADCVLPRCISFQELPEANYTVLSPYLLPLNSPKKVNIGDGFILDSAAKLIGFKPATIYSSRAGLNEAALQRINTSRCLIAIGANTLKDDFELAPGFNLATLKQIKVPVILLGIGHYGVAEFTRGLSNESQTLLRAILERFPHISVRCDASLEYLTRALPDRAEQVLMTSCPVVFPIDRLDGGFTRKQRYQQLVVTLTDRRNLPEQLPLLNLAPQLFPAQRKVLALHQDYHHTALWSYASELGYEIFRSPYYEDFLSLYAETDVHFGNRLHAHLKCLANGVVSFLTPFDLRQAYFAESLDFPLIAQLPDERLTSYDFYRMVKRRTAASANMEIFIKALHAILEKDKDLGNFSLFAEPQSSNQHE